MARAIWANGTDGGTVVKRRWGRGVSNDLCPNRESGSGFSHYKG